MVYTCNYLHNSGKICGRNCNIPEGCGIHCKSKKRFPCKICGIPTSSKPGLCRKHCGNYYVLEYYKRMHAKALAYDQLTSSPSGQSISEGHV